MPGLNFYQRWRRMQDSTAPSTVAEVTDDLVSTPTASMYRVAAGTGVLVSGTVAVATGLNTVLSFTANMSRSTGVATGVTEVNTIWVGSITTGSVTVTGSFNSFVTGSATLSASGTSTFYWIAFGT